MKGLEFVRCDKGKVSKEVLFRNSLDVCSLSPLEVCPYGFGGVQKWQGDSFLVCSNSGYKSPVVKDFLNSFYALVDKTNEIVGNTSPKVSLDLDKRFDEDLGLTGFGVGTLATLVEERYSLRIPDEVLEGIFTIRDFVDYLQRESTKQ